SLLATAEVVFEAPSASPEEHIPMVAIPRSLSLRAGLMLGLFFSLAATQASRGQGGSGDKKPLAPPEGVLLKWRFGHDKPFFQTQTTVTKQTMKVMGQEVKQDQTQTYFMQWTPLGLDRDGNYRVKQKIVGVVSEMDIGGNKITFDSRMKNAPMNPLSDMLQ